MGEGGDRCKWIAHLAVIYNEKSHGKGYWCKSHNDVLTTGRLVTKLKVEKLPQSRKV